ncbi:hypothetical protein [Aureimonas glaciei]|nr:hypothetical protein [Aureimonas glaciei]
MGLAANAGYSMRDLSEILRMVRDKQDVFLEAWHDHFG